jgi:hypothetical protein
MQRSSWDKVAVLNLVGNGPLLLLSKLVSLIFQGFFLVWEKSTGRIARLVVLGWDFHLFYSVEILWKAVARGRISFVKVDAFFSSFVGGHKQVLPGNRTRTSLRLDKVEPGSYLDHLGTELFYAEHRVLMTNVVWYHCQHRAKLSRGRNSICHEGGNKEKIIF